ncbi:MAG: SDR family oxidoreductase [Ramlibacter sp.]
MTGAASGIGLAVARLLLQDGWHVVLADANQAGLDGLRQGEFAQVPEASMVLVDVTDEAAVRQAMRDIPADRPLAGVVNSAGIGRSIPFAQTTVEVLRGIFEVNVVGTFIVCQAAALAMGGRGGAIVNISSGSGLKANFGRAAYGSSKAAVEMLSKVMAVEFAPRGIRVNTVAPGPIETPMVTKMHTDADRRAALGTVPMRRYGQPDEVAQAVTFLLDTERASFITGETLCVDGGFYAAGAFPPADST